MASVARRDRRRPRALLRGKAKWIAAVGLTVVSVAPALAQMKTRHVGHHLCQTRGGGKFVPIPSFPGERIDRRILPDVKRLVRKYELLVTDGFSMDSVHDINGEHPLGLALDVVPDKAHGGSWKKVGRLAHQAE